MSGTFPSTLPGIALGLSRTSIFATKLQESRSGKELATAWWSLPKYRYTVNVAFLRQSGALTEMATLVSFFEAQKGQFDTFQFTDPYDSITRTCRFEADEMDFMRDEFNIWKADKVTFRTVK